VWPQQAAWQQREEELALPQEQQAGAQAAWQRPGLELEKSLRVPPVERSPALEQLESGPAPRVSLRRLLPEA